MFVELSHHAAPHSTPAGLRGSTRQVLRENKKKNQTAEETYVGVCRDADVLHNRDRQGTDAQMRLKQEPVAFPQR